MTYLRTEEHNKRISETKKERFKDPEYKKRIKEVREQRKDVVNVRIIDPMHIVKKGVHYYLVNCIDCGEPRFSQIVKGSPKNLRCLSCATTIRNKGRKRTPESKAKTSMSLMGHSVSEKCKNPTWLQQPEIRIKGDMKRRGRPTWNKGKKVTDPNVLNGLSERAKRMWESDGFREKYSQGRKEYFKTHPGYRKGSHLTEEQLQKLMGLPDKLSNYNKSEQYIDNLLQRILPDEYKYNGGCQLRFRIRYHVPDFVHINGKKKIIEFNGCVWHCCPECGNERHPRKTDYNFIRERDLRHIEEANERGYQVLTIWEHELGDEDKIIAKILEFHNS